ncbi:unnamed protein product [Mucor hiemalis]
MSRNLPSPLRIKRVPVCPAVEKVAPVETPRTATNVANESKISVTVKVLKPSSTFTIGSLSPNDTTVSQLKQRIYQQQSSLPVNRQKLLIKGKVLADQKTLSEVGVAEGAVIHLMVTAAPASTSGASATTPIIGRFGVSAETEQKLSTPEFWSALEKTITDQVGEADAKLLFSKVKASLTA